jgi:SAM-dependent methyltransferase
MSAANSAVPAPPAEVEHLLRCPVSQLPLRSMSSEQLRQLNRDILQQSLRHLDGTPVGKPADHAFVSEDGRFAYAVLEGIILLLPAFAIVLRPQEAPNPGDYRLRDEKKVVQDWYNQFGWQTGEDGRCWDSIVFGDFRPVTREYGHKTHLRPLHYLRQGGKYILDVASGAVPQPEYLNYSDAFERRICMDLSFVALQQAQKKLGAKGIYIMGDITNLPLQDNVCDAVISLHTIYHVPADEQASALRSLHRVLKPGRTALVIYNWERHSLLMRLADIPLRPGVLKTWHLIKSIFSGRRQSSSFQSEPAAPRPQRGLYFHAHNYKWFRRELGRYCTFDLVCWRSVNQHFLAYYIRPRFFGRALLRLLFWFEEKFPRLAARVGAFPMFIIHKRATPLPVNAVEELVSDTQSVQV